MGLTQIYFKSKSRKGGIINYDIDCMYVPQIYQMAPLLLNPSKALNSATSQCSIQIASRLPCAVAASQHGILVLQKPVRTFRFVTFMAIFE